MNAQAFRSAPNMDLDYRPLLESDFDRLSRAQRGADLLAALSTAMCAHAGISADHTAAVADMIQADLKSVLLRLQQSSVTQEALHA